MTGTPSSVDNACCLELVPLNRIKAIMAALFAAMIASFASMNMLTQLLPRVEGRASEIGPEALAGGKMSEKTCTVATLKLL